MKPNRALVPVLLAGVSAGAASAERTATPATPALKVMTYNVNYADSGRDATMAAIDAGDADVVLLQEVNKSWEKLLRKRFAATYPHMVFHPYSRPAGGLAVLSRVPITDDEILPPAEGWFPAERLTIDSPLGSLDILHVHLRPAILDGSWITGYLKTPPIRLREIEAYWNQLPRPPAIVAGDFNEEPGKGVAGFLADKGLTRVDSGGDPTSWSWTGTYGGHPVALALDIDHVVIGPALAATAATVLDQGKSDHRPVVVTLTAAGAATATATTPTATTP